MTHNTYMIIPIWIINTLEIWALVDITILMRLHVLSVKDIYKTADIKYSQYWKYMIYILFDIMHWS